MGIIRPKPGTPIDAGNRWAITLDVDGEQHLVGTRAAILEATRTLDEASVSYAVYRRPGKSEPWQLVQDRHGRAPFGTP